MGTVLGVLLTTMIGYVLSRPNYKLKGFFTWMVFIPMIFNGGMVANYVVVANMLRLNNTIWCLILPLAMSSSMLLSARPSSEQRYRIPSLSRQRLTAHPR